MISEYLKLTEIHAYSTRWQYRIPCKSINQIILCSVQLKLLWPVLRAKGRKLLKVLNCIYIYSFSQKI